MYVPEFSASELESMFGPPPYIRWTGYFGDGDQDDPSISEPYQPFLLVAWALDADYRAATVDDLRLAGFVPASELDALRRRNEKLERVAVAAANVVGSRSKCPVFGPYSDVATIPLDELETALRDVSYLREATLSDLDKEDT